MDLAWRVSVVRGGRIVDERWFEWAATVPLGGTEGPRIEPAREGFPRLVVPSGVAGEVSTRKTGRERISGEARTLDDRARGYVDLAAGRVLFEAARKAAPKPSVLPKECRSGPLARLEKPFSALLVGALVVEVMAIAWVRVQPSPHVEDTRIDLLDRLPAVVLAPRPTPARPHDGLRSPSPAVPVGTTLPPEPFSQRVRQTGLLRVIGALGQDGALRDLFTRAGLDSDVAEALGSVRNVQVAGAGGRIRREAGGPDRVDLGEGVFHGVGGRARPVLDERRPVRGPGLQIELEDPVVPVGGADVAAAIAGEVRRRLGAVQACYERALRLRGGLSGRVELRLLVSQAGRVAEAEAIATGFDGAGAQIAGCIEQRAARWSFGVRPDEPMQVSFPLVFSAR